MGRVRRFVSRHRLMVGAGSFLAVGLVVFTVVWFQPQKLFIEKRVDEAVPEASAPAASLSPTPIRSPSLPTGTLATGTFRSLEHPTTGRVRILRLSDGKLVLRLEDLGTSNGPDLRVYLSEIPPDRGWHDYGERYLDLGALKGNQGNQNYSIPSGTDLSKYLSVVIWCRRFTVGFGVAGLKPPA